MALNVSAWSRASPQFLSVLRLVSGFLFVQHGTAKYLGVPEVAMYSGLKLLSAPGIAGVLELVGGALLLVGFWTRPTAFVLSGLMAFAYFIGHASKGAFFTPQLNGGELAILFCFVFLYISAAGGGPWSVDAMRKSTS